MKVLLNYHKRRKSEHIPEFKINNAILRDGKNIKKQRIDVKIEGIKS